MRSPAGPLGAALLAVALAAGFGAPARAQDAALTQADSWRFGLTPYIWFAGLKGDVAALRGLPPASVDASFSDILENTDLAVMLVADARRGPTGVIVDLAYTSISAEGTTPGPLFGEAEVESKTFFATVAGIYQVFADEQVSLDALVGARVWYVDSEIDLSAGLLPAQSVQDSKVWADPVIGLRGSAELGRGFFLAAAADIGGFGLASDFTWQVLGTLGYRFNDWFSARAGYRHLEVDYTSDGFVWDVQLSGPLLGASFRF